MELLDTWEPVEDSSLCLCLVGGSSLCPYQGSSKRRLEEDSSPFLCPQVVGSSLCPCLLEVGSIPFLFQEEVEGSILYLFRSPGFSTNLEGKMLVVAAAEVPTSRSAQEVVVPTSRSAQEVVEMTSMNVQEVEQTWKTVSNWLCLKAQGTKCGEKRQLPRLQHSYKQAYLLER